MKKDLIKSYDIKIDDERIKIKSEFDSKIEKVREEIEKDYKEAKLKFEEEREKQQKTLEEENKEKIFELIKIMKQKEELKLTRELLDIQEIEKNKFNRELAIRRDEWSREEEEEEKAFCNRIKKIHNNINELISQQKKREEIYKQQIEIINIDKKDPNSKQDPEGETIGISSDLRTKIRSHQIINEQLLKDIEDQRKKLANHKQMLEEEINLLFKTSNRR